MFDVPGVFYGFWGLPTWLCLLPKWTPLVYIGLATAGVPQRVSKRSTVKGMGWEVSGSSFGSVLGTLFFGLMFLMPIRCVFFPNSSSTERLQARFQKFANKY